jgi:hypothetical protein
MSKCSNVLGFAAACQASRDGKPDWGEGEINNDLGQAASSLLFAIAVRSSIGMTHFLCTGNKSTLCSKTDGGVLATAAWSTSRGAAANDQFSLGRQSLCE